MGYTIREIKPRVFLVEAHSQYAICSMFMRPQEFYESPLDGIQGNFFFVEDYMDKYAASRSDGRFSYYEDWGGFNIPGDILMKFFKVFQHNFTAKEVKLYEFILGCVNDPYETPFYVIGCEVGQDGYMAHEIAHAYWYLYPEYKKNMNKIISSMNKEMFNEAKEKLLSEGYDNQYIKDEIQAYAATGSNRLKIRHQLGWENRSNKCVSFDFKNFYESFNPEKEL